MRRLNLRRITPKPKTVMAKMIKSHKARLEKKSNVAILSERKIKKG